MLFVFPVPVGNWTNALVPLRIPASPILLCACHKSFDEESSVCFVKQIFRKSSSNSFGSQHESFSDFTKGCGTYPSFLFPSMSESVTRRLSPLNSTSLPWCTILSTSADASLSSANTVPHFPNSMLVVSTIDWRS